ncbi:ABC transporter substrate-binding protein [Enterocloster sp. OA13]|uniref:ABC transporter substrate-binding protein n=1 Tax=Enterocloster sp. OA13 TaxID=2914161 RepID=UPI001F05DAAB|nr:ABC transporter substrate-binding protein [Enterocloster sp. OA13]
MKKRWMTTMTAFAAAAVLAASMTGCGAKAASSDTSAQGSREGTGQDGSGQDGAGQDTAGQGQPGEASGSTEQTGTIPAEGTDITFWHSMGGVNGEALDYLVNRFNTENTLGIKVDAQYQGEYDDAINKLKSAQIGNMGADLVQIYDIGTRFMIDSGWVVPMQELMDADGWDKSVIEPNIAAYYTVDDKLYSMPFNSSTPILYYNKDMFEKAGVTKVPESLMEIADAADALVQKGGAGEPISLGIYGWFFEQFTCKQGLSYVNNGNGRQAAATAVDFDRNGAAVSTLTAWKELYDKGYAPIVGRGGDSGLADFSSGKSAMTLGSTASLKQILGDVNGKFEVGTAYFPKVNADDKGGVSIGGASLWALNNEDDAKKAATWEFVKFLVSPESQAYWNAQTGYFPVTADAHDEPVFKENMAQYPQFGTAIDQLHDSAPESAGALLSVFPEARQVVETEIENMLNNNITPEDTAANMAKQINKAIEEYNLLNE